MKDVKQRLVNASWLNFSPEAFTYFENNIFPTWKEDPNFYPALPFVFKAYNECLPEDTKVVILGQDPYFDSSANGLAFDNNYSKGTISPSLKNILKELKDDVGEIQQNKISHLQHLPSQGVLLINTALTVRQGEAGSHSKIWKPFTESIIKDLQKKDNIVWILWGNHAKSFKPLITNKSHYILEGVHPMPLAANRGGFFGGKYFSEANAYLGTTNQTKINW